MITIYSEAHSEHFGKSELIDGVFHPSFECPERAIQILASLRERSVGPIIAPDDYGISPLASLHSPEYIEFFQNAWQRWVAEGNTFDMLSMLSSSEVGRNQPPKSKNIFAQMGYYSIDMVTPVTQGSWTAAYGAAQAALTAQNRMAAGARAAYALCRPPGHHAGADYMAGFCYFNNAAVAAQAFLRDGAVRVSILDVDYHHGNGTQGIFYNRSDVQFLSIHADPGFDYPFYVGFENERGAGTGEGFNFNYPLPENTAWSRWSEALTKALKEIERFSPDVLIVSLGVDTFKDDPMTKFLLENDDFIRMGELIGSISLPTMFVQEGGYDTKNIGVNVTNVLGGYLSKVRV
ncbi:acetylpolyamine amidohydrolase [Pseudomonas ogarae]|uniref:histone deacetylase family protein n=1 Tax=Pseudomonas ogarae (strain DSM 112162 / CECT 30235 / F113) TaxID=1114970 RepID=UPI0009A46008|nr:histone deacetylase family protein [Pseudomonas ogarae]OPG72064.1 acetylpolyamine amidohydrolase [Pseudomonas ogarae]